MLLCSTWGQNPLCLSELSEYFPQKGQSKDNMQNERTEQHDLKYGKKYPLKRQRKQQKISRQDFYSFILSL